VFYIVTEFVDGQNLSKVLSTLKPTPAQLVALTRRLAEGLNAAHALGAIHRDMSADNVMLEGGRLEGAKIIDFGIAKDLDPGSATIVGDGFAGKLNYVAPEQLGDFNREVGPWTDVYSLALVILAVAQGKDVDMGGTLVDAVDKRRAGPDLTPVPPELRPVIEKMLKPNPAERVRSMGEVLELLGASGSTPALQQPATHATVPPLGLAPAQPAGAGGIKLPAIIGGGAAVAVLAAAGLYFAFSGGGKHQPEQVQRQEAAASNETTAATGDVVVTARTALDQGLPGIACTWLNIVNVTDTPEGISVVLRGVAGKPAEAQAQIAALLAARKLKVAGLNFEDVSPIKSSECTPLESFRQIRDPNGGRLSVAQRQFEMATLGDVGQDAGKLGATAIVDVNLSGSVPGAALFGLEDSGEITPILPDRAAFDQEGIEKLGEGRYRLPLATTHKGWSGLLLLTGKGPFAPDTIGGPAGSHGPEWRTKFLQLANAGGWKSEMVWYKTVDEQPN
jgi:serine/threonine-protein kinase